MAKPKGVFCVEGEWHADLAERGSVLPTLELLERLGRLRFIHRDTATVEELRYFLDRWLSSQRYASYEVGFFALHGSPTTLHLSGRQSVELDEMAGWMAGRCTGKRLYFGSCSTLQAPEEALRAFLRETGAAMVCGFTKNVDWVESAAFETVLVERLVNGGSTYSAEALFRSARWAPMAQHLGFRAVYRHGASPRGADPAMVTPRQSV
ncbi:DUF6642 family protein [Micromonospora sp. WMMD714]|uniref:DUF6642 family protein n=1 Tax=Micromonospora sp. WMMD714 TaxID=3016097 RepID=UPI00249B22DA|nr:DUF6642 family protein [Micromonospora sp. WMMD714]WFE65526.1 hypothetical protein O7625_20515 [Micromonospora sp. WMMD714]